MPQQAAGSRMEPPVSLPSVAERESGGHRGRRAAGRAAGAVAGLPRVLHVAVVGVVAERAHRQLGHVELAQGHGARCAQPRHRRALARRREVFARLGAARGRQAGDVTEVLVGERHAVQRAPATAGRELGFEGPRARQRALGVERDERVEAAVEPRDAVEAGLRGLDRRDLARGDRARQALDRPVSHGARPGSRRPRAPARSPTALRRWRGRPPPARWRPARPATSAVTRCSGAFMRFPAGS